MIKLIILACSLLAALPPISLYASNTNQTNSAFIPTLSLKQAVLHAYEDNAENKSAQAAIDIEIKNKNRLYADYFPTGALSGSIYHEKGGTDLKNALTFSGQIPVFSMSGPRQLLKRAAATIDKTKQGAIIVKRSVEYLTESTFLQAWLKQEEIDLLAKLVATSKKIYALKKDQFEAELIISTELASFKNDLEQLKYQYQAAQEELLSLLATLEELTNLTLVGDDEKTTNLRWQPEEVALNHEVDYYLKQGLARRAELKIKDLELEEFKADVEYIVGKKMPVVGITGSISRLNQFGSSSNPYTTYTAGVGFSWNLFDGFVTSLDKDVVNAKILKTSTDKTLEQRKITREIKTAFNTLRKIERKLRALKAELVLAQKNFKTNQAKLDAHLITVAEFSNAVTSYYQANYHWLHELSQHTAAHFKLRALCGFIDS